MYAHISPSLHTHLPAHVHMFTIYAHKCLHYCTHATMCPLVHTSILYICTDVHVTAHMFPIYAYTCPCQSLHTHTHLSPSICSVPSSMSCMPSSGMRIHAPIVHIHVSCYMITCVTETAPTWIPGPLRYKECPRPSSGLVWSGLPTSYCLSSEAQPWPITWAQTQLWPGW